MRPDGARRSGLIVTAGAAALGLYLLAGTNYGLENALPDNGLVQLPVAAFIKNGVSETTPPSRVMQKASLAISLTGLIDQGEARAQLRFVTENGGGPLREFVTYDMSALASRQVGDRIAFLIPELGFGLNGLIERREDEGEAINWSGRWTNLPGGPNKFTITQVPVDDYAHAIIETAAGTYVLEAKNGIGWLQNANDIARTLHQTNDGIAAHEDSSAYVRE